MKLLVTGAGGFLGREVVRQAALAGHAVRAMVRNPAQRGDLATDDVVVVDLARPEGLAAAMTGVEGVIHCAATTSAAGGGPALAERVNVEGTRRLVAAAHAAGVARWVQISSMSAHPGSTSVYGRTKLAADEALRGATLPPAWTILRPSLIYGPGRLGLVAKTLEIARKLPVLPMLGSGRERLRPVFIGDVAQGALAVLTAEAAQGQSYMLGGADEVTLDAFMRRLLAGAGLRRRVVHLPLPICMALARTMAICVKNPPITVDNVLGVREAQPVCHESAQRDWGWMPMGLDQGLALTFADGAHHA